MVCLRRRKLCRWCWIGSKEKSITSIIKSGHQEGKWRALCLSLFSVFLCFHLLNTPTPSLSFSITHSISHYLSLSFQNSLSTLNFLPAPPIPYFCQLFHNAPPPPLSVSLSPYYFYYLDAEITLPQTRGLLSWPKPQIQNGGGIQTTHLKVGRRHTTKREAWPGFLGDTFPPFREFEVAGCVICSADHQPTARPKCRAIYRPRSPATFVSIWTFLDNDNTLTRCVSRPKA